MIKNFKYKKYFILILLIVIIISLAAVYSHQNSPTVGQPIAKNGYLDLSNWNFDKNGNIKLDGEWEYYWRQLVSYQDFSSNIKPDAYLKVPGFWRAYRIGEEDLPGTGYATYRLKVKTGQVGERLGLKIQPLSSAYRVFINDKVVAESGVVSADPNTTITRYKPAVVSFDAPDQEFDIIVQAANFSFPRGGFWYPIYLGTDEQILQMQLHNSEKEMLLFGGLLTVTIYILFIYLLHRKELTYLYIVLFSVIVQVYMLVSGEFYLTQLFPNTPFSTAMFLVYMVYYWVIVFFTAFIKQMFPQEVSNHIYRGMFFTASILTLLTLFLPGYVYAYVIPVYDYIIVLGLAYTLYRLILAVRNRRQGAGIMLIASLVVLFTGIHDLLYQRAVYVTPFREILPMGAFVLTLCQSFVVAKRYNQSFLQIQKLSTQLMFLDKFNDEFLISTAHELKTPLHGVMNLTKIVVETEHRILSEDSKKNLEHINSITKKLSGLIDDIVDLHQIRENRRSLNIRIFDCHGAIQHVMDNLKYLAVEKGLELLNNLSRGDFYIKADENRLRQIVHTLIDNAIKFTDCGRITVDAYKSEGKVHITFTDTGIGIADKRRESLSGNFPGGNSMNERPEAGPGLAFYIASWIARYMEGDLRIKWTEVGKGTCLELALPLVEGPINSLPDESFDQVAVGRDSHETIDPYVDDKGKDDPKDNENDDKFVQKDLNEDRCTILIVDDEPTNLLVLKEYFLKKNYQIMSARTGDQALSLLGNHREISMILLDVLLPDSTGYAVCRKIREKFTVYELPVILLTIRNTPEEIHECMTAGANDFIIKPFVNSELNARVQTHLELKDTLKKAVDMEVMFLQSQIKPHFIYNAISVISSLSIREPEKAKELILDLSDYLRGSFDFDNNDGLTTLQRELGIVRAYLAIEQARFKERLAIEFIVDDIIDCTMPMLSIQPLVENAVRHGIMPLIEGGRVIVTARNDGDCLRISVSDNGVGIDVAKAEKLFAGEIETGGVGLKNIHRRLIALYGKGLTITGRVKKGTTVEFIIPYEKKVDEA